MELKLITEQGATERAVPVVGTVTIGRDPACEIALDDPRISRRHARIVLVEGRPVVEDLGSSNGTWINGRQSVSAPTALSVGDELQIGDKRLRRSSATSRRPPCS